MNEIQIMLSLQAIRSLTEGEDIVVRVGSTIVRLAADDATVNVFQQHVHRALMELLPVSNTRH